MKLMLKALLAVLFVCYPLAVYVGLARFGVGPVALLLAALALLRLGLTRHQHGLWPLAALAFLLGLLSALTRNDIWLRYYPVVMNATALIVFAWSLHSPPPVIERLARLRHPDLPPSGVRWTRHVTQVWCGFFMVNGGIALYTTVFCSMRIWTLYNGLIAYGLMGVLLGGEFLLRQRVLKQAPA